MQWPSNGANLMKHGIPICRDPVDAESFYMRNLFHEYFYGPFPNEQSVIDAIKHLDSVDSYWDYDPATIIRGILPLPKDYVFGFPHDREIQKRIFSTARAKG